MGHHINKHVTKQEKLIRNKSTRELRAWWEAVHAAAVSAPRLKSYKRLEEQFTRGHGVMKRPKGLDGNIYAWDWIDELERRIEKVSDLLVQTRKDDPSVDNYFDVGQLLRILSGRKEA